MISRKAKRVILHLALIVLSYRCAGAVQASCAPAPAGAAAAAPARVRRLPGPARPPPPHQAGHSAQDQGRGIRCRRYAGRGRFRQGTHNIRFEETGVADPDPYP